MTIMPPPIVFVVTRKDADRTCSTLLLKDDSSSFSCISLILMEGSDAPDADVDDDDENTSSVFFKS